MKSFSPNIGHKIILELVRMKITEDQMPTEYRSRRKIVERLNRILIAQDVTHNKCMESDRSIIRDGSLMHGRAGARVNSAKFNLSCSLRLGKCVSVSQSELLGLLHALYHLPEYRMHGIKVLVAIGSQSASELVFQTSAGIFKT